MVGRENNVGNNAEGNRIAQSVDRIHYFLFTAWKFETAIAMEWQIHIITYLNIRTFI